MLSIRTAAKVITFIAIFIKVIILFIITITIMALPTQDVVSSKVCLNTSRTTCNFDDVDVDPLCGWQQDFR